MKKILLIFALILALASPAWADCKSECKAQYGSDVESCNALNDDPEDANILKLCIESAEDDYDSCTADCEDEYGTGQTVRREGGTLLAPFLVPGDSDGATQALPGRRPLCASGGPAAH